jgi:hypothetical protein
MAKRKIMEIEIQLKETLMAHLNQNMTVKKNLNQLMMVFKELKLKRYPEETMSKKRSILLKVEMIMLVKCFCKESMYPNMELCE